MKRFLVPCLLILCVMLGAAPKASAQTTPHSTILLWTMPTDATAAGTITVYRGIGDCSTAPAMSSVGSVVATITTYTDPIGPGTYCYFVIHTENKTDSVASNTTVALLRPNAASGLTVTVK